MSRVAIVSLGRGNANGEVRRVASWRLLFEHAGADVTEVALSPGRRPHADGLRPVLRGRAAPERLAWSGPEAARRIAAARPDVIVCVSSRSFDPVMLHGARTVVLDFVDCLSRSYRDRSQIIGFGPRRAAYRTLGAAHRRLEGTLDSTVVARRVAAGWSDATRLDATWVPIVGNPGLLPADGGVPTHDLVFFGTLRYPPNVDALEALSRCWPSLQAERPGTTMLVAGSQPTTRVLDLCRHHGWALEADFESLPAVLSHARLAVVPLQRTVGVQIKVLDAAWLGVPQVVTSAALAGYGPDFPLTPRDDDASFLRAVVEHLEDPDSSRREAYRLHRHVHEHYSVEAWTPRVLELVAGISRPPASTIPA